MRPFTDLRAETFPIGAISQRSGVNIETIRYYERIKMLAQPPRTASGHRMYNANDLRTLVFIRRSRELGFSLDEISALLRLSSPDKALVPRGPQNRHASFARYSGQTQRFKEA